MKNEKQLILSRIPKVDVLLERPFMKRWEQTYSRNLIKVAIQQVLSRLRQEILDGTCGTIPDEEVIEKNVIAYFQRRRQFHLQRVINGTGTILHTNLGRAVLGKEISEHVARIASSYSNLEYDLEQAHRGSRYQHLQAILKKLTGAEDVLVVNNNAAAVMLALTTLIKGKEVIISRGELVEIGGFFRIPEVIELSGGTIHEVGTTNKTHMEDYHRAINENTGAIMKVHTSNYRIIGFTETAPAEKLAALAHEHGLPFINDLGSGLFIDMRRFGLPYEPTVSESLNQGCDVVTFSGDKLLGGPQAGIIVGKKSYIEQMKKNQLLRALRVDKMTLAALEATLQLYLDEDLAVRNIPVLQMLAQDQRTCMNKAERLHQALADCGAPVRTSVEPCRDMVGGGSYPEYTLPGYVVTVEAAQLTAEEIEQQLRHSDVPVICRIQKDKVCLSVRTIEEDDFASICEAVKKLL
ncbi:MAG: L-seryl-tRNA(Sec) selenium transferase [Megasphaera sp.]|jgi:L-seryl-tRNA(Ser) seleniumtransferase|nr:L-seryl-tRNA(Sec) selenium transferase [Megasphaera sp.]